MVLAGDYKDKKDDELAQLIGQINFVVIMLIYQFTNLFAQIRLIADILACGKRVSEVYYSDSLMNDKSDGENFVNGDVISNSRVDTLPKSDTLLSVQNATINRYGTRRVQTDFHLMRVNHRAHVTFVQYVNFFNTK